MGLEKIRAAVLVEATAEANRMADAAHKTRASFVKAQIEAARQEYDRLCKLRMQAIEDEYNRRLIQHRGQAGKEVLDKRNALLKSLFEQAKKQILGWPPERYAGVMKRLIEKTAGEREGKIKIHPDDRDAFLMCLAEINKGRGEAALTLDPGAPLPERGGFVFVRPDFEVDQTLDTVMKDMERDMIPALAAELFRDKDV